MTQASVIPAFRYRAFISYSHQDKAWADWLHKALETYAIPKRLVGQTHTDGVIPKRLTPIFRDRDELASAHDLGNKVNEALAQSANLIVICSPRAAASRWVDAEVLAFKRLGRTERVFCLIVEGEPNASNLPGREAEECFAAALRYRLDAEGQLTTQATEPIAADARPGKDGKTNAKLKLVAGLLDVGFDALKRRELQRRTRRMTAIAALAFAVMVMTTALAIFALVSRHAAVVASQAAERRQKQAEDLVGFMLGDLSTRLNEVHRLDIMQAVDDKAMAYFASLPSADITDEALAQRVSALEKIGSVSMDLGQTPAALKAYQAASALAAELARRSPGKAAAQAAYGDSLKWIGQAYWYQGDLDHALQNFKAASAALRIAQAARPEDTEIAFKLAMVQFDSGLGLEKRGELTAAKKQYQAVRDTFEHLHARQPTNTRWQSYLGYAWSSLGEVAVEQDELDQAINAFHTDQRIKAALAARDPSNHDAQFDLATSNLFLGSMLELCGETEAALRYTRAAVAGIQTLLAFDSSNAGWQDDFAITSQHLGEQLRQLGQLVSAAAADRDAVRVLGELATKDPSNHKYPREWAASQLEGARLQLVRNDVDAAQSLASSALETIVRLRAATPVDRTLTLLAAQTYAVLGEIGVKHHDSAAAHGDWVAARETLAATVPTDQDPKFLAAWASALLRLDQTDMAQPVVKKLAAMGYREPDFVALLASRHLAYPPDPAISQRIAAAMN